MIDYAVFYQIELDSSAVPGVSDCIRNYSNLHVMFLYKISRLPLPSWFVKGGNASLNKKSMLENFPCYIKQEAEQKITILEEWRLMKFQKKTRIFCQYIKISSTIKSVTHHCLHTNCSWMNSNCQVLYC